MRHLLKLCGVLVALGVMTGCSTPGDYKAYIQAQAEANRQAYEGMKALAERPQGGDRPERGERQERAERQERREPAAARDNEQQPAQQPAQDAPGQVSG